MTPEDYQKVKEIFQSALDIAPEERDGYVREKCTDNIFIRDEVERLLDSFDSDYLEQPAIGKVAETVLGQSNLSTGQDVGHYRIVKKIGAGGMGEVFLAKDITLGRRVAIKILRKEFAEDAERMNRFVREARTASALSHPNIITIYEISAEGGIHFIATEYIEGETLRSHLANRPVNFRSLLEIAIQIASALDAAHHAGIIHRDIKPENVMVRPDGLVKILDFGVAKLTEARNKPAAAQNESLSTSPGMIIGTANYMSPEQAQGKKVDNRSDIFSFGIVFYEMLTGRRPFEGKTPIESISSILKDEPQPISRFLPDVPPEIVRILDKALRKDREERYQTAKDLLTDLKDAKHHLEFRDELERSTVSNRETNDTDSLPAAVTDENQSQLTSRSGYIVAPAKQPRFRYLPLVAVLLVAGIGFGVYRFTPSQPMESSVDSVRITKITDSGKVGDIVGLSPDGKWLVYSILEGEKASLWLKQVAIPESNTRIVPPTAVKYRGFAFSVDGDYLYYTIEGRAISNCTLYQMPLLGGTPRKLLSGINGGIDFSPDGKQITYGVEDLENDESVLMIANADGTEPRQLVKLKGNDEIGSSRGRWSPDGRSIAVFVGTNNPKTQELATVSVDTGEITRLQTHKFSEFGNWEWLPDSKGFVVLARENPADNNQFWQVSLSSQEAKKITNDVNVYNSMSLSADANIFATVQKSLTRNTWIAPAGDPARATQVISGGGESIWTPDGSPGVLPDGKYVVYISSQTGTPYIWRMDKNGGNPKQLTTEFSDEPRMSPDGLEVIYTVGVDTARIWKVGIEGGEPVQLTDKESRHPVFSPDGKQFACKWWDDPDTQPKIAIIPSTGGKPVKTYPFYGQGFRWTPDGRSFVYLVTRDGVTNIWSHPIDVGKPKQLTNFTSDGVPSFEFSPDGKQIAFLRETVTTDVVLISGLRRAPSNAAP